ncbi:Myo-inositol 2-dehydrogenase [Sporomusa silvacetica DSM 10669]|uniref:Myo-inositol 2-dehydrogenase n=1 Tax=Sporomusa silvacetica DSM 10669 TaxID=1123289 RepID=A0ABZ3ITF7_9FIRM|nr:Gfo/Idh/MocA family oxidoreductase [Sporomusa silvacetica]OZC19774.1 scyllo-inositol 2-dehydrogenase (NAD(+)) [Sporomusa silvacetica DSM 10669]
MSKIKFAIVGTGSIVPIHAQAISDIHDAALVAIFGRSAAKTQELAGKFNCAWYNDYQEMLKRTDIDAVSICTPNGLHAKLGMEAALAGKHVIIEKPIEVTLEKADALIKICQSQGVKLGIIFQRRYSDGVIALKRLLEQGKLGRLIFGGCYIKLYRSREYYDSGAWRGTWDMDGGGVLMNQGIHYIDMLQFLAGSVAEVTGHCGTLGHTGLEVEDTASAAVKFQSGALGVIEGTTCAYPGLVSRIDIYGTEGSAVIENEVLTSVQLKSGYEYKAGSSTENAGVSSPDISFECHRRQFQEIITAFKNNMEPPINGLEGRKALEVILAIYKSAFTGNRVTLPLADSLFLKDLAKSGGFKKH